MSSLLDDFDYYLSHQDELVAEYNGKFIALKDGVVLGAYESQREAIVETAKTHELGTFLVQLVGPGKSAYQQTFHSRLRFG
jgi:hypothetical protein